MEGIEPLFPGEPGPLPAIPERIGVWTVTAGDAAAARPPRVRHALGYAEFVALAAEYGTDARALFDLWAFAHFVRAHRDALESDPDLLLSAVVFLGNVCIANHPECSWVARGDHLAVASAQEIVEDERGIRLEPEDQRSLGVGGTVPALLTADEQRFREFQRVVDDWRPGAHVPGVGRIS